MKFFTFDSRCFIQKISGIQEVSRFSSSHYLNSFLHEFQAKVRVNSLGNSVEKFLSDFKSEIKESIGPIIDGIHQDTGAPSPPLQLLERSNATNGISRWMINEFGSRLGRSRGGDLASIYSAPFYTSGRRYKMRLRLDLNGRNEGLNSHMSLFLVLMRGEYDHQLPWPFRPRVVTFKVLNVAGGDDFVIRFAPTTSFDHPTSDVDEIVIGFAQFIPQGVVQSEFIMEDTIFIKCEVQTA